MNNNELMAYAYNFRTMVAVEGCRGDACPVFFLSQVDTWYECSCNKRRSPPKRHPEDESEEAS